MPPRVVGSSRSARVLTSGEAKLWLLLIGVNQYQESPLAPLGYCAADCEGIAEALLEATAPFPNKELLIHHDFAKSPPTHRAIAASLDRIVAEAMPQDTLLVYFCGHGVLDPASAQTILCLADTRFDALTDTGLGLRQLLLRFGNCRARQQLVWLDACHSGSLRLQGSASAETSSSDPTAGLVEPLREYAAQSRGFYAMLSCDRDQQSWEFPGLGHGVFTYFLMRGLRGEAANAEGLIEMDGLYKYVYHGTLRYIDNVNQQLRLENSQRARRGVGEQHALYSLQTPKKIVEFVGELVIGTRPSSLQAARPRRALVIDALADEAETTLALGRMLRQKGNFDELDFWPRPSSDWRQVREAIQAILRPGNLSPSAATGETVVLYLRGQLETDEEGNSWLRLGDGVRIHLLWLNRELRSCSNGQQLVILDCPGASALEEWVEQLRNGARRSQCLIASSSPGDHFAQALLATLKAAEPSAGLSAANWAFQLQALGDLALHIELSGPPSVIEVLPVHFAATAQQARTTALNICPYMGLRAFGEQNAPYFFGREALTRQLLQHIAQAPFLAVVGASGSGKSSVVQAGLIAQLRQGRHLPGSQDWWIQSFKPGAQPLSALSQRLADSGTPRERALDQERIEGLLHLGTEGFVQWLRTRPEPMVVLVIDQFEEIFTLASPTDRQLFLDLLLGALFCAADRFKLVVTLRTDFIAPCLEIPALAAYLNSSHELVPSCLNEQEYRQVILGPAQKVNLGVEPELVEVLLQELTQSPGELPLLEFVLEQLWEKRTDGGLTLQSYQQQIGGLRGALENKAQAVYSALSPESQACARWIFLSLTQLGEGTEDTRRRIPRSELSVERYPAPLVEETLQALTAAKLVVVGAEASESAGRSRGIAEADSFDAFKQEITVEVAHEILIRYWSTLRWWLDENRTRLRAQRQIEQAAQLWRQRAFQPDFLLRGVRLAEAEEIYTRHSDELSAEVCQFIEACLAEKRAQQRRANRQLRYTQGIAGLMVLLAVAALGFGILFYGQTQSARRSEIEALNASAGGYFASSQQLEALIASIKANQLLQRTAGVPDDLKTSTRDTLNKILYLAQEMNRIQVDGAWLSGVSFSHDEKTIATAGRQLKLWSPEGKLLKTLPGHENWVYCVEYSPQGNIFASSSRDGTIRLWSASGEPLRILRGHTDGVMEIAFSPDSKTLASASWDGTVRLWNVHNGTLLKTFNAHKGGATSVSFRPDGHVLASSGADKQIKLWNLANGSLMHTLKGHTDTVFKVRYSPDGKLIASASWDKTVKLWKSSDTLLLKTLQEHTDAVWSIAFSPDNRSLASGSDDSSIKIWNTEGGNLVETIRGHQGGIHQLKFNRSGKSLVSIGEDGTMRLWSMDNGLVRRLQTHDSGHAVASFSPDGKLVASGGTDQIIRLTNLDGKLIKMLKTTGSLADGTVTSLSFSPDNLTIAAAYENLKVRIWRLTDGKLLHTLNGFTRAVSTVAYGASGSLIVTASTDGTVKLWRKDGTLIRTFRDCAAGPAIALSPDGKLIAVTNQNNSVILLDMNGSTKKTLKGHTGVVTSLAFSPDGAILASSSEDQTAKLWRIHDSKLIANLQGHNREVTDINFSKDGHTIVSSSRDGSIKIWNAEGFLIATLQNSNSAVRTADFNLNSSQIVSADGDGKVILWNWQSATKDLSSKACRWIYDYLQLNANLRSKERSLCDSKFSTQQPHT
ncbi:AAA family ATPase [Gloeobacter kilaueensis]|uniref:WD-40 repeat-containing protein n=1 Tax=Gloeobacter kilaueensis (strain ATCC BAA-2537 / CCAP 1431/1 / ULC 316 / JS1) TaxID=1183438 RepID=U5QIA5_GLOK1|nr:AAA family ATPase [Gloeobacter kilaueensis]AGY58671.1 WD-40 repeat-containing protein [Gloeobacter kilaueensis JS1]